MSKEIRELWGMEYKAIEFDHPVTTNMGKVLRDISDYLLDRNINGLVTSITTQSHPDDEDRFLTTLVWAIS